MNHIDLVLEWDFLDELNNRFSYIENLTHEMIFRYINKITLTNDALNLACNQDINFNYPFDDKWIVAFDYNSPKQLLHRRALEYWATFFFDYFERNYWFDNVLVSLWWGTALMLKYNNFHRFSLDLDFSFENIHWSNQNLVKDTVIATWEAIVSFLINNWAQVKEGSNWSEIIFEVDWYWQAEIKIDWQKTNIYDVEKLSINWKNIIKSSDCDIVAWKMDRLSAKDLSDIDFLRNNIDLDKLDKTLYYKWYTTNNYRNKIIVKWKGNLNNDLIRYFFNIYKD